MKQYAEFNKQVTEICNLYQNLSDKKVVVDIISKKGLYRAKGYFRPFLFVNALNGNKSCTKDVLFVKKTMDFDSDISDFFLKYSLVLEYHLSLVISEILSKNNGPYWYGDGVIFKDKDSFERINEQIRDKTELKNGRHPHPGVVSYYQKNVKKINNKFPHADLPSWIVRECVTFGFWLDLLNSLATAYKDKICARIPIRKITGKGKKVLGSTELISWVLSIKTLRNACAHNSLIISRSFIHNPSPCDDLFENNKSGPNLAARLIILNLLIGSFDQKEALSFSMEIISILEKYSELIGKDCVVKLTGIDLSDKNLSLILDYEKSKSYDINNSAACGFY